MPRRARLLVPGCPHHIVQRGHNRKAVFVSEGDCQYYLENLAEWKASLDIKIYAWCLMTNHIHLLVEPMGDPFVISTLMKRVNGRQTAYVNKLEGRSGSLWEGRYKASPVQKECYLMNCCRYIELNPVRAGMVSAAHQYPWSSYAARQAQADCLLDLDPIYLDLADSPKKRFSIYSDFVAEGIDQNEQSFITRSVQRNQLTGDTRFLEEVEERIGLRVEKRGPGRPSKREN